ncbi:MAG: tRNA pseudouridine(13) synthase TruD [Planctomycetota bacterium]|jgi:tRNA pseudouridine13 synthase|nr:hypothetical protein [Candidatus Woesearchaeota archaeon]MDP6386115.1 tRNA pseudouridine(13) synthase TruD [Planctomycetota bacterium]
MRLKQQPGDFRVDEVLRDDYLQAKGRHRVYRVTKRKLTSIEAARFLGETAGVSGSDVSMAGLKDKQGVTTQYMSIQKGKRVQYKDQELDIETVGFGRDALSSHDSNGNAFQIIARDLGASEVVKIRSSLDSVREHGLPNYFDEQRFGNLRHNQGWIAKGLMLGQTDQALKRLLTAVSDYDPEREKSMKVALARKWGNWRACRDVAGRFGRHHSVFEHLRRDEDDFAGAFRFVASRIRLIHLYAWQSHVWNRALARHFDGCTPSKEKFVVRTPEGPQVFPKGLGMLPAEWEGSLPLPGNRLAGVEQPDQVALFEAVLQREGLTRFQFAIEGVPGFVLKPEPRPALVVPQNLRIRPAERDPRNRGQRMVKLSFQLPRGSYATLAVRRLLSTSR